MFDLTSSEYDSQAHVGGRQPPAEADDADLLDAYSDLVTSIAERIGRAVAVEALRRGAPKTFSVRPSERSAARTA